MNSLAGRGGLSLAISTTLVESLAYHRRIVLLCLSGGTLYMGPHVQEVSIGLLLEWELEWEPTLAFSTTQVRAALYDRRNPAAFPQHAGHGN